MPGDFDYCVNCHHRGFFHKEICLYEAEYEHLIRMYGEAMVAEEMFPCGCKEFVGIGLTSHTQQEESKLSLDESLELLLSSLG